MASKKDKHFGIIPKDMAVPLILIGGLFMLAAINSGAFEDILQAQQTTVDDPLSTYVEVDATISFSMANMLNGSAVIDGSLVIYDVNDPGVALDTLTISSGSATSAIKFHTGRVLGVKYTGSAAYLDFSWPITVPAAADGAVVAVSYPTVLKVVAFPTVARGTDFSVEKDGTLIYDGDGTPDGVDGIDPSSDTTPEITIKFKNSGEGNTGYGNPLAWTDYATTTPGLESRASWFVVEFALNASGTTITNVNDYLRFKDKGGFTKTEWGTSVILYKAMDSEYLCGFNDDDDSGNTQHGLTGNGIVGSFILDNAGSIATAAAGDEIVIRLNFQANYGINYMLNNEVIAQSGDKPYGVDGGQYIEGTDGSNVNYRLTIG